jgi:hypothetical protein
MTGLKPENSGGLADAIERILDRGLVINADISVSVAGTELLGIKIRAALASFETAAHYGLEFPSGTNLNSAGWREADRIKAKSPEYLTQREEHLLIEDGCSISEEENPHQKISLKTDMI